MLDIPIELPQLSVIVAEGGMEVAGMGVAVEVLLPLALAFIMFVLGLGLRLADFQRIFVQPKAFAIGFAAQVIMLPVLCFVVVTAFMLPPELAFGMMILALCPGGPSSNILAKAGGGDVALSVSLTSVITLTSVLTIPVLTPLFSLHFLGVNAPEISIGGLVLLLVSLTLVPIIIGMGVRFVAPDFVARIDKGANRAAMIVVTIVIIGALAANFRLFIDNLAVLGLASFCLAVGAVAIGWSLARMGHLPRDQQTTIAIDTSTQNGTLGIAIGALIAMTPGAISSFSVPSGVYSIFMYAVGVPFIIWRARAARVAVLRSD
jgi:bile acid:Na+ symporter, BASS family